MPIEIRPYEDADGAPLRELYLAARQATFHWLSPATFELTDFERETRDELILVAVRGEEPIGFVSWWPPADFIHNLFVSPARLRQGIGRQLLSAALDQIGRPATLKCAQANATALRFYESLGWEIAGEGDLTKTPYFLMRLR